VTFGETLERAGEYTFNLKSATSAFGSQIRSYVLHPYQMVKDHRTKEQVCDISRVLDGDVDVFIKSYLMKKAAGSPARLLRQSPAAGVTLWA